MFFGGEDAKNNVGERKQCKKDKFDEKGYSGRLPETMPRKLHEPGSIAKAARKRRKQLTRVSRFRNEDKSGNNEAGSIKPSPPVVHDKKGPVNMQLKSRKGFLRLGIRRYRDGEPNYFGV